MVLSMKDHSWGGQKGEISSPNRNKAVRPLKKKKNKEERRLEVAQKEKADNENLNRK